MSVLRKVFRNSFLYAEFHRILPERQASVKYKPDKLKEISSGKSSPKEQRLYVWGLAELGALGEIKIRSQRNKLKHVHRPIRKSFAFDHRIVDFSCGYGFTLYAVKNDTTRKVFGSGLNTDSQLGYHTVRTDHPLKLLYSIVPTKLPLKSPRTTNVIKVAAGRAHSIVLTDNEGVFSMGNNAFGQCGRPVVQNEDYGAFREIYKITALQEECLKTVECGQDHSLFLTEGGQVFSCGCGADGQTGLGHLKTNYQPTLVEGDIKGENIVKLSSSGDTVLALNDKGEVFGWGNSEYFQIPNDKGAQQISTPMYIKHLSKLGKIIDVASGSTFSIILTEQKEVYVWGFGIIGRGPQCLQATVPQLLPSTLFGRNQFHPDITVESIHCGISTLAAVTNRGDLYMWGKNQYGQLGIGSKDHQYFPYRVAIGASVKKISCGADHTMALCKPFV